MTADRRLDAFMWTGAATGSVMTAVVYALTAWYVAVLLCVYYTAVAVRRYRRAYVLPLREQRHSA